MRSRLAIACSLLLLATSIDAVPYDFNFLDNYRRPAPSVEDSPPAAKNASRDKALLPAQICGVVGAYVITVLLWGILLLTVGRKMRKRAENPPKHLELELVTARHDGRTPASPASARSATSWFRRGFKQKPGIDSTLNSPVVQSPASFDQKVIEADRDRAMADMERLYAAVMEHDKKKSESQVSLEVPEPKGRVRLQIDTTREAANYSNPASPIRPIYPPGYNNTHIAAPHAPRDLRVRDNQPPASPRSILSKRSMHSTNSTSSHKSRLKLKNLRISSPMKYPDHSDANDEARTPLSPRFYGNPGAPPSPPTQQNSPTTPGELEQAYAYEQLDEPQPLPRPAPQRLNSSHNTPISAPTSATPLRSATSTNDLPYRSPPTTTELPLRGYAEPLRSPDLRTTVLDRRADKLSLQTPRTGVPYTPYSPYMPFTPLTPVTPHLVTRQERRRERKEVGSRGTRGEELVRSPKEIFGDAY